MCASKYFGILMKMKPFFSSSVNYYSLVSKFKDFGKLPIKWPDLLLIVMTLNDTIVDMIILSVTIVSFLKLSKW